MRINTRKGIHPLKTLFVLGTIISLTLIQTANAGIVVPGVTTNPCDGKRFMGFEEPLYRDKDPIASTIPGLQFTTTDGWDWVIGDFSTGLYNGKYPPRGRYTSDGNKWVWLGAGQSQGRIDFTYGTAAYFSLLTSTESGLILEAVDANGAIVDSATAGPNPRTGWMTRLIVNVSAPEISYIRVHDTGNFFLVDDICTDAPAGPASVNGPSITTYSPLSPVYDISGATRTFSVTINQTVNVTWYLNGSQVQTDGGVMESEYTNTNAPTGSWNVTAVATNINGTAMQVWDWIVTEPVYAPAIIAYSPASPVHEISGAARTFTVTVNQSVTVRWLINGTQVGYDEGVMESAYTNANAAAGSWNVTAIATNVNGTAMQTWDWIVTEPVYAPAITAYSPASPAYDISGAARTFNVTVNQTVNVIWYLNGTQVYSQEGVTESTYTNTSAAKGTWTINAVATNVNGTVSNDWIWNVSTQAQQDKINATIVIKPECLNLASKGKLTAFITLPEGYNVTDINLSTVVLEGAHAVKGVVSGKNGGTLIVKFNRQDLINVPTGDAVVLTVTGKVLHEGAWVDFEGSDTIRVMEHGGCNGCATDEEHDECDEHNECKDHDGSKEDNKCNDYDESKEQHYQKDNDDSKPKDHSENEQHPGNDLKDKKPKNTKNFNK